MRPERFVVGLTGGIGTGKSSALDAFRRLGAATVSLDRIAREQAERGREGYKAIVKNFGTCILKKDLSIDRALLGRVVFNDHNARAGLERATHPLILKEMKKLIARMNGVVIADVPLLFEKGLQKKFDATILIACKPDKQLKRIMKRDGLDPQEARRRMAAQWPMAKKQRLADVAIHNDRNLAYLQKKIREYHEGLTLLHGGIPHGNDR
ncbi:MAG: dephospho-CoA kinase [Elusimicrobia bacterium]|nr:dephospho-CoA kinase [Elusimicrobiota bacterium]